MFFVVEMYVFIIGEFLLSLFYKSVEVSFDVGKFVVDVCYEGCVKSFG